MSFRYGRLAAGLLAGVLSAGLLVGCSGNAEPAPTPTAALFYPEPADTPAARLRAEFTAGLVDWTWLGAQANAGSGTGDGAPAAAAALENHTVALAALVGKQYKGADQPALAALRLRDTGLQKYAAARRSGDAAALEAARRELDTFRTSFAAVIAKEAPTLAAERVAESLKPHVEALLRVIDAQVGEDGGDRRKLLVEAASETVPVAQLLAEGITADKQLAGTATSPAANLRADLTRLLVNHAWLTGSLSRAGVNGGGRSEEFRAAETALDGNSAALADVWARHYPESRDRFLQLWNEHIALTKKYISLTQPLEKAAVRVEIENHRRVFGEFLNATVPDLPQTQAIDLLGAYVRSLLLLVDSQATSGDVRWYGILPQASGHMFPAAAGLAGGIAKHKRLEG